MKKTQGETSEHEVGGFFFFRNEKLLWRRKQKQQLKLYKINKGITYFCVAFCFVGW